MRPAHIAFKGGLMCNTSVLPSVGEVLTYGLDLPPCSRNLPIIRKEPKHSQHADGAFGESEAHQTVDDKHRCFIKVNNYDQIKTHTTSRRGNL